MQEISSRNERRKMQDSRSFTFCWGETFDTPPYTSLLVIFAELRLRAVCAAVRFYCVPLRRRLYKAVCREL